MKFSKLFMGLLGALAFTACSSDDVIPDNPNPGEGTNSRFMTVSIRNANPMGRAGGDQSADGNFEYGFDYENKVDNVRFYFFDENGEPFKVRYTGQSFFDCDKVTKKQSESTDFNVEQVLEAVVVLSSSNADENFSGIKSMVAIANYTLIPDLGDANLSLAQLKEISGSTYFKGDNTINSVDKNSKDAQFLMTSSAYVVEKDGVKTTKFALETEVANGKIRPTREEALANPVDLYIERVVAKVRVATAWNSAMETKTVTFNDQQVTAVKLRKKDDKGNITDLKTTDDDNGKNIWLVITGWDLSATAPSTWLFKKVNPNWEFTDLPWQWYDDTRKRSYWAMNSNFNWKDLLIDFDPNATAKVGSKTTSGSTTTTETGDALYCFENAADYNADIANSDGLKSGYDPSEKTRDRTVAYIAGALVTVDETTGVATEISYAEWAGQKYTEADLLVAMFAPVENIVYVRDAEPYTTDTTTDEDGNITSTTDNYHFHAIRVEDMIIVPAEDDEVNKADTQTEDSRRYLSYLRMRKDKTIIANFKKTERGGHTIQTTGEGETQAVVFYEATKYDNSGNPIEFKTVTRAEANANFTSLPGARVWPGKTYFFVDFHHLNFQTENGAITNASAKNGGYGVVRNHIYDIELNSVYGLGTPILSPKDGDKDEFKEFPVIPQKPSQDAFYLAARINILSWRVVKQGTDLEW